MAKQNIPDKYAPEDVEQALSLLDRHRKQKEREKEKKNDPAYAAKQKARNQRQSARQRITLKKAHDAGITVSEAEIDTWIADKVKK